MNRRISMNRRTRALRYDTRPVRAQASTCAPHHLQGTTTA